MINLWQNKEMICKDLMLSRLILRDVNLNWSAWKRFTSLSKGDRVVALAFPSFLPSNHHP